jgi:dTDP-4-amino-4,6-dideoxygalactose transaminase
VDSQVSVAPASPWQVDFNRATLVGSELEYVRQALESGRHAGDGPFARRCETFLERHCGAGRAFLTPSGTHALELAALLLELTSGDEVIVPSFTFPSTANAFALRGAVPVFADIRPDTLNIDEESLTRLLTPRTRAIVVVHYAGVACEMDAIVKVASASGVAVIEDNAHGLFGSYRGRALGTFGRFAAHSFHESKNVSCGEGGALFVNEEADVGRAEIAREKGTDRTSYLRGDIDRYSWVGLGSSYLLGDVPAAMLLAQLQQAQRIGMRRKAIWQRYEVELSAWALGQNVTLPVVPADRSQTYHIFYLLTPSGGYRERLIRHLAQRGIPATFHYLPLHLSDMGRRYGARAGDCPVTEDVSERILRLPIFFDLSDPEQTQVIEEVQAFSS